MLSRGCATTNVSTVSALIPKKCLNTILSAEMLKYNSKLAQKCLKKAEIKKTPNLRFAL